MTRFVVILIMINSFMINGLSDACLLWGIGPCIITHRLRCVNWTRPGLDLISLCRSLDGLWGSSCCRLHRLSYFIVRILRRFCIPADWCRGLTLPFWRACRHLLFWAPVRWADPYRILSLRLSCPRRTGHYCLGAPLSLPGSLLYNLEGSVVDVSSGTRGSVVTFLPQEVLLVDTTNSLYLLSVHRLDVGPISLYDDCSCVKLSHHGFAGWRKMGGTGRPFPEDGWTDFGGYWSPMGTSGCRHVSYCVCADAGSALGSAGSRELAWSVA